MIYYFANNYIPQNQEEIKKAMGYGLILTTKVELSGQLEVKQAQGLDETSPQSTHHQRGFSAFVTHG